MLSGLERINEYSENFNKDRKYQIEVIAELEIQWQWKSLSCVWLFVTLWSIWSMELSRPEYWSG